MLSPTIPMISPTCTDAIPLQYCSYPSTVLNSLHSIDAIPQCTAAIALQYWCYSSALLMLSPTVLMLFPHSTEQPPQYWCYPSTVLMLFPTCTDAIPLQCCSYPSTVLNSLHSTDAIPPHALMLSPAILNSLRSTEPTLYGVVTETNSAPSIFNQPSRCFPGSCFNHLLNHRQNRRSLSWIQILWKPKVASRVASLFLFCKQLTLLFFVFVVFNSFTSRSLLKLSLTFFHVGFHSASIRSPPSLTALSSNWISAPSWAIVATASSMMLFSSFSVSLFQATFIHSFIDLAI